MNRIEEFRKKKKWTAKHLAELVGTSAPQIFRLEKGERKLSQDWMERISKVLDCSPADLISDPDTSPLPTGAIPIKGFASLPVLGSVQAGAFLVVDENQIEVVDLPHIDVPLVSDYAPEKHYLLKVIGDSMNKRIPDGYHAICVEFNGMEPKIGDIVVVERLKDGGQLVETTIKRLSEINGRCALVPESHDPKFTTIYPDQENKGTEVKVVAKVVNAIAGGF